MFRCLASSRFGNLKAVINWSVVRAFSSKNLLWDEDKYDGILVHPASLSSSTSEFHEQLETAMAFWKTQGKRGVWLKIPIQKSTLIPIAVSFNFEFHHCDKDSVTMTRWLPKSPNTLPAASRHNVGVGGVVVNKKDQILMVVERNGDLRDKKWLKIPTGTVESGENLDETAVREVKEETGVDAVFDSVICFRHSHGRAFGNSDLFFMCLLHPLSEEIKMQESELVDCKWIPLNTLLTLPHIQHGSELKLMLTIAHSAVKEPWRLSPMKPETTVHPLRPNRHSYVYHNYILD